MYCRALKAAMVNILLYEFITNSIVLLYKSAETDMVMGNVKKRRVSYYGHLMRKWGDCSERGFIQGIRGQKKRWADPEQRTFNHGPDLTL